MQGSTFSHQNQGHLSRMVAILFPESYFLFSVPSVRFFTTLSEITGPRTSQTVICVLKKNPEKRKRERQSTESLLYLGCKFAPEVIKLRDFQPPLWRCYAPYGGATFLLWGGNMAINIVI